ncbi:hypothetical protein ACQB60_31235 [Actinomycetota bacterium Odt1-20B]
MTNTISTTAAAATAPALTLDALANETRMIATPWSRMVRGIGLGQYPVSFDHEAAARIRHTFGLLEKKGVTEASPYTRFSQLLADLVLTAEEPGQPHRRSTVENALGPILHAIRAEKNPYFRLMATTILVDTVAKLGLDSGLLVNDDIDIVAELLQVADAIEPDQIKDENAGRHGHYERLSAYSAAFLAIGQLGLKHRLVADGRDYVTEALHLLEKIPAPFYRGRGGSMLLSVITLLGYGDHIHARGRDYIKETLDYLDRADEIAKPPAFPQPMSDAFVKIYPLLTLLNAIAMTGRSQTYLTYGKDRLAEAGKLLEEITPVERTHMGLYYLVALNNLGVLEQEVPDQDAFVKDIVGQWEHTDPGLNYFLNGIAYAYIIQTAMLTGSMDQIGDGLLDRYVAGFPDLDRTDDDRVNRPYPFAYALNVLGEIGEAGRLFTPHPAYGDRTPTEWVIDSLSEGGKEEGRLYMLNHALVSYALRLRGSEGGETPLFADFRS